MYYMKLNVQIDVSIGEDSSVDGFSYPINNGVEGIQGVGSQIGFYGSVSPKSPELIN